MKVTTTSFMKSTILKFCPLNTLQIKRKTVLDVAGNVKRWWFIIHAPENLLLDLEGSWDQLQLQTGWKLVPCFKPADPLMRTLKSALMLMLMLMLSSLLGTVAIIKPLKNLFRTMTIIKISLESLQDHNSNQASLESCQTSFLRN